MFPYLDLTGVILSAPGFLIVLFSIFVQVRRQWYHYRVYNASIEEVRTAITNLHVHHNSLLNELRACHESLFHSGSDMESHPSFNLSRIHSFIHSSFVDLVNTEAEDRSRKAISRFLHSKSICSRCQQLKALADRLADCLQRMRVYCPLITFNASHARIARKFIDDLRTVGHACEIMIQTHQLNIGAPRPIMALPHPSMFRFKSEVYVAKNPSFVTLDFNGDTPEGRLKECILRGTDEIHDIFQSRKVVLEGQKGSGRKCIMRALPTCHDIQNKFVGRGKGGIYCITVGHNSDLGDVKRQMSEIVNMSGGWHLRERMLQENLSAGVLIMADWFMHRDTLFLVSEIDNSPFARALEEQLETLSKVSGSSVVVFLHRTDHRNVARESDDDVVYVPSGSDFGAEEWLLRSLGIDPKGQMKAQTKAAFDRIVGFCNREKRLLGQVSVCYKHISHSCRNGSGWETLARKVSIFMRGYQDVEVALTALFLDLMKPQINKAFPGSQSIQRLYQAFQIVHTKGWIPQHALSQEWNFGQQEYSIVQSILVQGRLCQITKRLVNDVIVEGIEADGFWSDSMRKACQAFAIAA